MQICRRWRDEPDRCTTLQYSGAKQIQIGDCLTSISQEKRADTDSTGALTKYYSSNQTTRFFKSEGEDICAYW